MVELEYRKNDEKIFIRMLTQDAICGMIAAAWTYDLLWGCGCSGGGSPSAYFFAQLCCMQARPTNK
jgi:hypothetical protein